MISIHNVQAAVLLLVLTQTSVFSFVDYGKNESETSSKTMIRCLRIPWIDGLTWLTQSCKSSSVKEASEFIRAYQSGEKWAVQKLEELQNLYKTSEEDVEGGMGDECVEKNDYCTHVDTVLDEHLNQIFHTETVNSGLVLKATAPITHVEHGNLSPGEICTIIFLLILGAFLFTCTICDFVKRSQPRDSSTTVTTLAKFSLYTNALVLLRTRVTPDTLPALHGLRCLCLASVVIAHRYFLIAGIMNQKINLLDIMKWKNSWIGGYIWVTGRYLDTFFLLASFLLTYRFFKSTQSGSKINVIAMYLHRYIRITPCLAAVILLVVVFTHRAGSGPLWKLIITNVVDPCRESWWVNLLYLQNFVKKETQCLIHTWYLAVDMQLFWMSPIILYPLHRWPKFGVKLLIFFIFASVVTPAYLLVNNRYWIAAVRLDKTVSEHMNNNSNYTVVPYTRACPYLLGILLGYDIATKKRRLCQVNVAINWVVSVVILLLCIWFTHTSNNSDFAYDLRTETVFSVLLRPSWSIAMAWIVYACTCGYGGVVTRFFSLPIFFPLSRLSYCVYLISMEIQTILIIMLEADSLYGFGTLMWTFVDLMLSVSAAFVVVLCFESPLVVLEKMITNRIGNGK